jgi:spermidine/putrescine transport system permease protein
MLTTPFGLGTTAQIVGLVTFQLSYPVVIVRARLLTIGSQYEEAARDLGASALGAVKRVLLPMLSPAILVSAILVFADVLDNFVIVRYLSSDMSTETTSMRIYSTARAAPTPALNALATLILLASLGAVIIGWLIYRRLGKNDGEDVSFGSFTGNV